MKRKRNLLKRNRPRRPPAISCEDRLSLLAQELGLAGGQILAEQYDFTPEMVNDWMKAMASRARRNRVMLAVETVSREAMKNAR